MGSNKKNIVDAITFQCAYLQYCLSVLIYIFKSIGFQVCLSPNTKLIYIYQIKKNQWKFQCYIFSVTRPVSHENLK